MRRLLTLAVLLLCAVPFGVSIAGCSKATPVTFCDGNDSGLVVGQIATLDLEPKLTGLSFNEGQIGSAGTPAAFDCKSSSVSSSSYTYGSTNINLVDVQPTTGRLCAGSWNRNTGGGIPDFTVCTSNNLTGVAYVTASAGGATSNALPVFVHPVVTSVILGPASADCVNDPASDCVHTINTAPSGKPQNDSLLCDTAVPIAPSAGVTAYDGTSCISQGQASQLVARTYAGATNISCMVGPLTFTASNPNSGSSSASSVVTIDTNGIATAAQPGSALINANVSQSSSSAGFFSTCPPKSIVVSPAGQTAAPTSPLSLSQNVQQDLVATVLDTNNNPITNISLTYESTVPQTVPVAGSIITPTFPGSAAITAICEPPTCNTAPFDQIGLFGNGLPITSNAVQVNAKGTGNSTVLYIGSTGSQYIQPYDFTVSTQSAAVRLPYAPNSMVLSEDLSTIYMGSPNEIMVFNAFSNQLSNQITGLSGSVLAVSDDNSTVVITDPVRKLTYLYLASGSIETEYGAVATHAEFSPDSQTVYITTNDNRLLVYSTFTGWTPVNLSQLATDVAITVPNEGAYLAGATTTAVTNCPTGTLSGSAGQQTVRNVFFPQSDADASSTDRISATNDGRHILGASASAAKLTDLTVSLPTTTVNGQQQPAPCPSASAAPTPQVFTHTTHLSPFVTAVPASITGVLPTSDSAFALVTYTGTGGVVPQYTPSTQTLTSIALQKTSAGTPTAPVAGVISSDNQTAYIGTSGDNVVHVLTRGASGFTDSATPLTPALPGVNGGIATPNLLVQRPRKSTS